MLPYLLYQQPEVYDLHKKSGVVIRDPGGAVHDCSPGREEGDVIGEVASLSLCALKVRQFVKSGARSFVWTSIIKAIRQDMLSRLLLLN